MNKRTLIVLCLSILLTWTASAAGQSGPKDSGCVGDYENHNQINNQLYDLRQVEGSLVDPGQGPVADVCVEVFTETEHKFVRSVRSDAQGKFSFVGLPAGRYRLLVKAKPLCTPNVRLRLKKHAPSHRVLRINMRPRGIDSCSFGELTRR